MEDSWKNTAIGVLGFCVIVIGFGYINLINQRDDYRRALDDANSRIDTTATAIQEAKDYKSHADYGQLHDLIDGLDEPVTIDDPHPN